MATLVITSVPYCAECGKRSEESPCFRCVEAPAVPTFGLVAPAIVPAFPYNMTELYEREREAYATLRHHEMICLSGCDVPHGNRCPGGLALYDRWLAL